jgi:hypothetical protein
MALDLEGHGFKVREQFERAGIQCNDSRVALLITLAWSGTNYYFSCYTAGRQSLSTIQ